MYTRLEKILPAKNQRRFYTVSVNLTLFGEWAVVREWGRIGSRGGQQLTEWYDGPDSAFAVLDHVKRQKEGRGYVMRPEQLALPL